MRSGSPSFGICFYYFFFSRRNHREEVQPGTSSFCHVSSVLDLTRAMGLDEVRASIQGAYGARFQKLASTIQAKGRELSE